MRADDLPVRLAPDGARLISIGVIAGTHGVRGEVRMRPHNPDSSALAEAAKVFLIAGGGEPRLVTLARARPHGAVWLLVLDGVATLEQGRALAGQSVAIPERELPALRAGEFYHYQLIGLAVVDESGEELGEVKEVLSAAGNDLLVVHGAERERLIPLIDRVVREIDLAARRIVVHPIDGLLD